MGRFLRNNGLSVALLGSFLLFQGGLSVVGLEQHNQEQEAHGKPTISYGEYLTSPPFLEATMENWESEFLQMFAFVIFTVFLYQKGSPESKDPDKDEKVDKEPDPEETKRKKDVPGPVRRGGIALKLYENSLSITLLILFLLSFYLHAVSGSQAYSQEQVDHGNPAVSPMEYLDTPQFWFESLQNWQSEFFSIGVLVLLAVVLRQRGSTQSKPVDSPHGKTGTE